MPNRLLKLVTTNLGTKLISIVIALVLWVIVLGSRNDEIVKEVPLEVVTPSDIVPSNEIPDRVAFRLTGPKAFLRAISDRREEPIRVNLANAKPGLVTYKFMLDNIGHMPIGVKVISISPAVIPIKLEYLKRREIPVRIEVRGTVPDGLKVSQMSIQPDHVRIKGAETRVDAVSEVSTLPIDLSVVRQSIDREAALDLSRLGLQLDGPLPRIIIDMDSTSANFKIKNVDIRVLTSYKFDLEEKTVTVHIRANPRDLKSVDRNHVFAVVDLRGKPKGQYTVPIKVTLPENIFLVKVLPESVNVTLH